MPRQVDAASRRAAIAAAAHAVAVESGVAAVSFRKVAEQLGWPSTTAITHYVPTRGELLHLTFHHAFDKLESRGTPVMKHLPARAALAFLIEWALPLRAETRLIARLWLEVVIESDRQPELRELITAHMSWYRGELRQLIERLDVTMSTDLATDLIATALDGIALAALAEPDLWPARRQRRTAYGLLSELGVPALRKPSSDRG